ncbi:MAG: hypothetical protein WBE34_03930 [Candidatus Nitrosopolaris sp.]
MIATQIEDKATAAPTYTEKGQSDECDDMGIGSSGCIVTCSKNHFLIMRRI